MTDLAWSATRTDTIDRFQGQTPRPEDEDPIISIFELQPQLVLRAIDETATALEAGKITWAWSVLKARLERGTSALREATANPTGEKAKLVAAAERWIRNAGIYHDRETDITEALYEDSFGDHGQTLRDYTDDAPLNVRLLELWREQRPRGEQGERLSEEWMAKCRDYHRALRTRAAAKRADPEPDPEPAAATTAADDDIDFG